MQGRVTQRNIIERVLTMKLLVIIIGLWFIVIGLAVHVVAEGIAGAMDNSANRIVAARMNS